MVYLIVLVIILCNAFFVLAEVALIVAQKIKLERMMRNGSKAASYALDLSHEPEKYLSTVQIGITLMSILLGFYGGSVLGDRLEVWIISFFDFPYMRENGAIIANTIVLLIITYLTVLGEIIPKRIGMMYAESMACFVAYPMRFIIKIGYPLIGLLSVSARVLMRLLNVKHKNQTTTVEELKFFVNQAEQSGTVDKTERDMIRRLIHLSDMAIGAVMTPRNKIVFLDLRDSDDMNLKKICYHHLNTFPVINGDPNEILGIVNSKEIMGLKFENKPINLQERIRTVLYVPEVARLTQLMEQFKLHQIHTAMVVDEYGDIEGIVTLNDILKTFVGDIATLVYGQKPNIVKRKNGGYTLSGMTLVEELKEILGIDQLPGEDHEEYRTVASFMLHQFNKVPSNGEKFICLDWEFKVLKMDNLRIEKVSIIPFNSDGNQVNE